jgi:long-chain fatty acid transport protein
MPTLRNACLPLAIAGVLAAPAAHATLGYYGYGYGTQAKGMAGASTALPLDAVAGITNPATLVHLGNTWAVGATLFNPNRGYTADPIPGAPAGSEPIPVGSFDSKRPVFLIPNFAYSRMLDDQSALTLSVAGNGGMNTRYNETTFRNFAAGAPPEFQATEPTGVDLVQLAIGLAYSRKLNDRHSVGVTPILAIQALKVDGLQPFKGTSIHPDAVTNNGYDYSYGAGLRIGYFGQLTDQLSIGASWQSKLYMTKFEEYEGLLAEEGDFDIAPTANIGVAFKATDTLTFAFDIQRIFYEAVDAVSNRNDFPVTPGSLGGDDGLGFGWEDQTAYKFGVQWEYSPDLTFRAGYIHANQVVPDEQALFNIIAPAVTTDHFTLGLSKKLGQDSALHFSFMHAPNEKVHGTNPNTGPQTGFIEMDQYEFEVSYSQALP